MKYEEVINKSKNIKAPDLSHQAGAKIQKHGTMESILDLLKKTDSKTRGKCHSTVGRLSIAKWRILLLARSR